ncbi:MAG: NAD-dependent epimerase/dehydratase family protein [Thermodesulfobacteriota bacterium]
MNYWSNKKILITGGAGFIGSNLTERLVFLGNKVRVIDNLERGKKKYLKSVLTDIEFLPLDLRQKEACITACKDIEIVFHLASKVGGIGYYLNKPGEVILENSLIDTLMLSASLECNVERYLYASSAHVYPIELQLTPDAAPIKEKQALPANPELSYGWAKLLAEKQIEYYIAEGHELRVSIVRLIGVFGKNQDIDLETGSAIPVFCRRAIEYPDLKPFIIRGTGKETRSYCYIDNVIDGMLISVEKLDDRQLIGPLNLGSEGCIAIDRLARMVIEISGKLIDLQLNTSKATTIWGQTVDCTKAKELLDGWTPKISLYEGLQRTYEDVENRLSIL